MPEPSAPVNGQRLGAGGNRSYPLTMLSALPQLAFSTLLTLGQIVSPSAPLEEEEPPGGGIILIVIDTLNPTRLGCYGGPADTPTIDSLATAGMLYEDVWSESTVTAPSFASILTGRHLTGHGLLRNGDFVGTDLARLPEELRRKGYRTAAFVSNGEVDSGFGFYRGFELYDDRLTHPERNRSYVFERLAPETVARALDWLGIVRHKFFFVALHLNDPHGPYDPVAGWPAKRTRGKRLKMSRDNFPRGAIPAYQSLPERNKREDYLASYDAEIEQVDRALATLFSGMRSLHLTERSVVVLTADHGESLGGNALYFQHGSSLYEEQLRVPLIFSGPSLLRGRSKYPASTLDIMPTILAAAGLRLPGLDGKSLLPELTGRAGIPIEPRWRHAILSAPLRPRVDGQWTLIRAVSKEGWKLIRDRRRHRQELYDLSSDPAEARNLARRSKYREKLKELDALLTDWEVRHPIPDRWKHRWLPPAKEQMRLRALGYMD